MPARSSVSRSGLMAMLCEQHSHPIREGHLYRRSRRSRYLPPPLPQQLRSMLFAPQTEQVCLLLGGQAGFLWSSVGQRFSPVERILDRGC